MKKFLITLTVILLAAFDIMAQEYLSFKGIPIRGSMTAFCQKLEAKGFTLIDRIDRINATIFTGNFTGQEVTVRVEAIDNGKTVYGVMVFFDPSGEWKTLVSTYDYYKNLYTRKYGKPNGSIEKNPAYSDSNAALMHEVYKGTVRYCSKWEVTGGEIGLSIEKADKIHEGMLIIMYRDSQSAEAEIQENLGDI